MILNNNDIINKIQEDTFNFVEDSALNGPRVLPGSNNEDVGELPKDGVEEPNDKLDFKKLVKPLVD